VGLGYRLGGAEAPTLEISGENLMAEKIVQAARRFGVPVVEDAGLAEALKCVKPDEQIPDKLFEAVAAVLNQIEAKNLVTNSRKGLSIECLSKKFG